MNKKEIMNERINLNLSDYMSGIIRNLQEAGKYPAVHTYTCTLHSFLNFSGGRDMPVSMKDVFTPGRLKSYQEWLLGKGLNWNTISTYMRTLRAVYNRLISQNPCYVLPIHRLFDCVYTKVESQTKRALSERQMRLLLTTDSKNVPEKLQPAFCYFRLMFLFRGMPFIDLAHLRKCDVHENVITYCRHKTGKRLTVRIPQEAKALLKMAIDRNPASIYLFPILDTSQLEGFGLYRCYQHALHRFNCELEKLASLFMSGTKISSYTARHSWATLSFHMGIPVGIISEALGHSSVRVTEAYLKPFENQRVDHANDKLIDSIIRHEKKSKKYCNRMINRAL